MSNLIVWVYRLTTVMPLQTPTNRQPNNMSSHTDGECICSFQLLIHFGQERLKLKKKKFNSTCVTDINSQNTGTRSADKNETRRKKKLIYKFYVVLINPLGVKNSQIFEKHFARNSVWQIIFRKKMNFFFFYKRTFKFIHSFEHKDCTA